MGAKQMCSLEQACRWEHFCPRWTVFQRAAARVSCGLSSDWRAATDNRRCGHATRGATVRGLGDKLKGRREDGSPELKPQFKGLMAHRLRSSFPPHSRSVTAAVWASLISQGSDGTEARRGQ